MIEVYKQFCANSAILSTYMKMINKYFRSKGSQNWESSKARKVKFFSESTLKIFMIKMP